MTNLYKKEQLRGFAVWLVILIVVAIIVIGVVILSFIFPKESPKGETSSPPQTEETTPKEKTVFDYEHGSVTILQGTIKEITNNTLTVEVGENEKNPALKGKSFQVVVGEQTKLFLLKGNFYIVKKNDKSEIRPIVESESEWRQTLSTKDLVIGDYLLVLSSEDIRDKDSFVAEEVYKR